MAPAVYGPLVVLLLLHRGPYAGFRRLKSVSVDPPSGQDVRPGVSERVAFAGENQPTAAGENVILSDISRIPGCCLQLYGDCAVTQPIGAPVHTAQPPYSHRAYK